MNALSPLKSRPLRNPGQGLDEELEGLINDKAVIYCLVPVVLWTVAGIEWFATIRHTPRTPGIYAIAALFATFYGAWRLWRIRKRAQNLRLGRDGERAVGQFLQGLQVDGLRVFHDVVADQFNLDHVVICERGIFVVETKTWSKPHSKARITLRDGQIGKDGRPADRDPIRQVLAGAKWLAGLLEEGTGRRFSVRGVVVFPGWFVEPMDSATKSQVWVLEPKALPGWIEREPIMLNMEEAKMAAYFLGRYVRDRS